MLIIVFIFTFLSISSTLILDLFEKLLNAAVALVGCMLLLANVNIHATKGPFPKAGLLDPLMHIVSSHGRHRGIGGILPPNSRWRGRPLRLNLLISIITISTPWSRPHVPLLPQRDQSVHSEVWWYAMWRIMRLGVDKPHNQ